MAKLRSKFTEAARVDLRQGDVLEHLRGQVVDVRRRSFGDVLECTPHTMAIIGKIFAVLEDLGCAGLSGKASELEERFGVETNSFHQHGSYSFEAGFKCAKKAIDLGTDALVVWGEDGDVLVVYAKDEEEAEKKCKELLKELRRLRKHFKS